MVTGPENYKPKNLKKVSSDSSTLAQKFQDSLILKIYSCVMRMFASFFFFLSVTTLVLTLDCHLYYVKTCHILNSLQHRLKPHANVNVTETNKAFPLTILFSRQPFNISTGSSINLSIIMSLFWIFAYN